MLGPRATSGVEAGFAFGEVFPPVGPVAEGPDGPPEAGADGLLGLEGAPAE